MKRKNKDINVVEKYFSQMNFIVFDVIASVVAGIGALLLISGIGWGFLPVVIILIGVIIKIVANAVEVSDSDFLDMVNHVKELADIDYRDKICFEQYDLTSFPIREGRDHQLRSNHLTVSLFSIEDTKCCTVELFHVYAKEHTFKKEVYKIPYTEKVKIVTVQPIVEKHTPLAYLVIEGRDEISIPVKTGSMDIENILERFGDK